MLNFDTFNIILFILPVYQMLFYTVQLITLRKNNDPSRRPLGFLMLLMLLYLSISASSHLGYVSLFNYLYILQLPILLAILPTHNLYLKFITNHTGGMSSKHPLMYYLPSVFILLLNIIAFGNLDPTQTEELLAAGGSFEFAVNSAMGFGVLVFLLGNVGFVAFQLITTSVYYFRLISRIHKMRKTDPIYLPHLELDWSHVIMLSVLMFVLLCSLMNLINPTFESFLPATFNIVILITSGLTGFLSLKQDKLFIEVESIKKDQNGQDSSAVISKKATIEDQRKLNELLVDEQEAKEIIALLEHHMVADKPYLDSNLRSIDLARKMGTSKQKLTYVINNVMNTNFYGVINKYRILEAKSLLRRPENHLYNIDTIMEMVGFQSKSSFNGCFKKMTGQTPSEFRKLNGK